MPRFRDPFPMVQGDLLPEFQTTLEDGDPLAPFDLTGCDVFFVMADADGNNVIDAEAEIVGDPTAGVVKYVWQDGDTDQIGTGTRAFRAQWVVVNGSKSITFPNDDYIYVPISASIRAVAP